MNKLALSLAFALFASSSPVQAAPPPTLAMEIPAVRACIQYQVLPVGQTFPAEDVGRVVVFPSAPHAQYNLRAATVEAAFEGGTTKKSTLAWGIKNDQIKWSDLQDAFESEVRKAMPSQTPPPAIIARIDPGPMTPGGIRTKISTKDLKKIGAVTSVIYLIEPNTVTAIAATVAGAAIVLDDLTGKSGLVAEYNPFIGMTVVIPANTEDFARKIITEVPSSIVASPAAACQQLLSDIKEGKVSPRTALTLAAPAVAMLPPQIQAEAVKIITNPGAAISAAPDNVKTEANKGLQSIERATGIKMPRF